MIGFQCLPTLAVMALVLVGLVQVLRLLGRWCNRRFGIAVRSAMQDRLWNEHIQVRSLADAVTQVERRVTALEKGKPS